MKNWRKGGENKGDDVVRSMRQFRVEDGAVGESLYGS